MSARKFRRGETLVIASHNAGKLREIAALVGPLGVATTSAAALGLAEPEETEASFEGNARIKAHAAARASGQPALADDSGLMIDALGGAPGVYTADWAETSSGRDFDLAMARAHRELMSGGAPEPWTARFVSVLALAWPDGEDRVFRGEVAGRVVWPPRGANGFGYDPMFCRGDEALTFGEITPEAKQSDDHRSAAFAKLLAEAYDAT